MVWRCEDVATGEQFACKRISRLVNSEKVWSGARKEAEVMARLCAGKEQGPAGRVKGPVSRVISLEGVYADSDNLYLVMELATGGDLLTHIQKQRLMKEDEARAVFADVLRGLKQCHDNNVVHRDIKPENILFCPKTNATTPASPSTPTSSGDPENVQFTAKIADFGLSLEVPRCQHVIGYAGSFPYEAPEVMASEPYDASADVWSLGVLLYAMLSGTWPLFPNGERRLVESGDWESTCWAEVSDEAKNLIRQMLCVDPLTRPTVDQLLSDPWLLKVVMEGDSAMGDSSIGYSSMGDSSMGDSPACGKRLRSSWITAAVHNEDSQAWQDDGTMMASLPPPSASPLSASAASSSAAGGSPNQSPPQSPSSNGTTPRGTRPPPSALLDLPHCTVPEPAGELPAAGAELTALTAGLTAAAAGVTASAAEFTAATAAELTAESSAATSAVAPPVTESKSESTGKAFESGNPKRASFDPKCYWERAGDVPLLRRVMPTTCLPFRMKGGGGRRGEARVAPVASPLPAPAP